jgi:hypothetical protein
MSCISTPNKPQLSVTTNTNICSEEPKWSALLIPANPHLAFGRVPISVKNGQMERGGRDMGGEHKLLKTYSLNILQGWGVGG